MKNARLWFNIALLRDNTVKKIKKIVLESDSRDFFLIISAGWFSGEPEPLIDYECLIQDCAENTAKNIYLNFNLPANRTDIQVLRITNNFNIEKLEYPEIYNIYIDMDLANVINKFLRMPNTVLSVKEIFFFQSYDPSTIQYINNNIESLLKSKNFYFFYEYLKYVYSGSFNQAIWLNYNSYNDFNEFHWTLLAFILYDSLLHNATGFSQTDWAVWTEYCQKTDTPPVIKYLLTAIMYKNNILKPEQLMQTIPQINDIKLYELKKIVLNSLILLSTNKNNLVRYGLSIKFNITNFQELVFYSHFHLKNFLDMNFGINSNSLR